MYKYLNFGIKKITSCTFSNFLYPASEKYKYCEISRKRFLAIRLLKNEVANNEKYNLIGGFFIMLISNTKAKNILSSLLVTFTKLLFFALEVHDLCAPFSS